MSIDTIEDLTGLFSDLSNVFSRFSGSFTIDLDRMKKHDGSYAPMTMLNLVFNRGMVSPAARSRPTHPQTEMLSTFLTAVMKGRGLNQIAAPMILDGGNSTEFHFYFDPKDKKDVTKAAEDFTRLFKPV